MIPSVRIALAFAVLVAGLPLMAHATPPGYRPNLGSAETFAVLGASTVTNTGASKLTGNVGVSPGSSITGFPPATFTTGAVYAGGPVAVQAQKDVALAYADLAGRAYVPANNLTGRNLGGLTLTAGVYHFNTAALLTGQLTFDARGNRNAFFIIQIGTTLTTGSNSTVKLIGGANRENVFWQIGSSATLGLNTALQGSVLAYASITVTTSTSVLGRLLAEHGAVTLDTNTIAVNIWQVADIAVGVDDSARILWNTPTGGITLASMDNTGHYGSRFVSSPYPGWSVCAVACGTDGLSRALWNYIDGKSSMWLFNANNSYKGGVQFPASAGWSSVDISVGSDNRARILRTNIDGRMAVWSVDNKGNVMAGPTLNATPGWTATRIACGRDGLTRLLLTSNADASADVVVLHADNSFKSNLVIHSNTGWTAMDISLGADNRIRLLWTNAKMRPLWTTGYEAMMIWSVDTAGGYTAAPASNPYVSWNVLAVATGADDMTRVAWARTDGVGEMWLMSDTVHEESFFFQR